MYAKRDSNFSPAYAKRSNSSGNFPKLFNPSSHYAKHVYILPRLSTSPRSCQTSPLFFNLCLACPLPLAYAKLFAFPPLMPCLSTSFQLCQTSPLFFNLCLVCPLPPAYAKLFAFLPLMPCLSTSLQLCQTSRLLPRFP